MAFQYKREYRLQVADSTTGEFIEFTDLKITFEITKTLIGIPNIAQIEIYNMAEDTAERIRTELNTLLLYAGYSGNVILLFQGGIRNVTHTRSGTDKITTIFAGDGQRELQESIFAKTFKEGFNVKEKVKLVAESFKLPVDKIKGLDGKLATLTGITLTGKTKTVLDDLSKAYNFNWSIQDGKVNIFAVDGADTEIPVIEIDRTSGMIGSPTLTEIGADVITLLNPQLKPNGLIRIQSDTPEVNLGNLFFRQINREIGNGVFRVNKVMHQGDSRGQTWQSVITGQRFVQ